MRLIDADALMEKYHQTTVWDSWVEINNAPTIDAFPVVRCKDCKYNEKMFCYAHNLIKNNLYVPPLHNTRESDFCSYGEQED